MFVTCLLAIVLSVLFYLALLPIRESYLGDLFYQRGWVPYAITLLMSWSLAILFLKWRKLRRQRESMLFDLLPTEFGEEIALENLDQFTRHVRELPSNTASSFLINRVLRGLEHFRVRRNSAEVSGMLSSQSDIDATEVDSSYVILNSFLAVIPLLGFVGTVIGISAAVGEFSSVMNAEAADIEAMKGGLRQIALGLQTAFDTTLVGLVVTIGLMFPVRAMQKAEDGLLAWVDEYCNENLLKRLRDEVQVDAGFSHNANEIRKAVNAAMVNHHAELQAWTQKLDAIGKSLTEQVVAGWRDSHEQMQSKHAQSLELINKALVAVSAKQVTGLQQVEDLTRKIGDVQTEQVRQAEQAAGAVAAQAKDLNESAKSFVEQLQVGMTNITSGLDGLIDRLQAQADAAQAQADQRADAAMQALTQGAQAALQEVAAGAAQTLEQVAQRSGDAQQRVAAGLEETVQTMQTHFAAVSAGLVGLNEVLTKLGEKQVVIEQHVHQHESTGWFGRRKKS